MATGGFGRLFSRSTNALINTGDGQALALAAGVPLKDMEFVQFHPTTLYGTNILITEGARGEGGILLNKNGERFMKRYAPNSIDLAPRDVIARAIENEISEGRGYDGGYVHLDLRHLGRDNIMEKLPGIRQISMDFAGIDPIKDPIPVQPGQHYSMGGIDVDVKGATPLKGLYAAGECACISVHGANRLGGNSLLETVVFGRLVADNIINKIDDIPQPTTAKVKTEIKSVESRINKVLSRDNGKKLFSIRDAMAHTMFNKFGIFRNKQIMEEGISDIKSFQKQAENISIQNKSPAINQALIRFFELENMLQIAEAVSLGAMEREESRGSHTRTDHPERDDKQFLKHTTVTMEDGILQVKFTSVVIDMFEPKERVY